MQTLTHNGSPRTPDLAIVILNWNNAVATIACVNKILTWQQAAPRLYIVDNGSAKSDLALLHSALPNTCQVLVNLQNLGFAGGNNVALKQALDDGAAQVLLLNNDAEIDEPAVLKLSHALLTEVRAAICGPVLIEQTGNRTHHLSAGGENIANHLNAHRNLAELPTASAQPYTEVAYVPGTAALLNVQAIRHVGYLDEEYFFSGEIADWCERARQLGYRSFIVNDVVANHDLGKPNALRATLYLYYSLRNRLRFTKKFASNQRLYYWYVFYLKIALGKLYRKQPAAARAVLLALWHGIIGKFGNQNHYFIQPE